MNKYNPLRASSYIKLPKQIQGKKAVINIENEDECCFAWAVVSALFEPRGHVGRTSSYPNYQRVLNFEGISFPVKLKDIAKFENLNNISINVYGLENTYKGNKYAVEIVGPLYYTNQKRARHINLLLISDNAGNRHYCWIKNISRLVSSQLSKYGHKKHLCDGCLQYFQTEGRLHLHQRNDCNHLLTMMPTTSLRIGKNGKYVQENILKFENHHHQMQVPFVVYADFESILEPIATCEPEPRLSFTIDTHRHIPYSFAYYIKCGFNDSLSKFEIYRGEDCAEVFIRKLEEDVKQIYNNHLKTVTPMLQLTEQEEIDFQNASHCHICEKPFEDGEEKVRDHCHLTGKYRNAAHSNCNLNFKLPNFIPIFFHNLSGYDAHLFVRELCTRGSKIDVIPQTKEKYITFSKYVHVENKIQKGKLRKIFIKLRFVDSYRFMSFSLDTLAGNLENEQCIEIKKFFPDDTQFGYMRQKGVFPYSYVDTLPKLNETHLPSKEDFFDKLNNEPVKEDDYDRAREVWNLFDCKTLGEYSDLYLKVDVLLLADIFENFRKICMKTYKLDPAYYVTTASLSWDSMLRYTGVELELLTDIDMLHFFKKGIRGGICQCTERKHVANNKFLSTFNPEESSNFIMYLDATNLYGYAMSQKLPISDFAWLSEEEIENFDVCSIPDDSPIGYVLEVDVTYPKEIHDAHSDLPFLVENMRPPSAKSKTTKLIVNLFDKSKYIVHYQNLKQALRHGLKMGKMYRVLKFQQSAWMKPYIDLNTDLRNKSKAKSDKSFYKLIVNANFGKCLENVDKRRDIRIVTHWENRGGALGAECLIAKPNFKNIQIFTEDCVAIQMEKLRVVYNKPIYAGFAILDISKIVMYDFYYDFIKKEYGDNASLMYMDTDSLILKISSENFYDEIVTHIERFDTSNYSESNIYGIPRTKSVVGKMKDEFAGVPIYSFYGTGAKAYYVGLGEKEPPLKKAKGIKQSVTKKELHENEYLAVVQNEETIYKKMNCFTSRLHNMYTQLKNKVALSPKDDKRFVIPGKTTTLAWGHKDIILYHTPRENNLNNFVRLLQEIAQADDDLVDNLSEIFQNSQTSDQYLDEIYEQLMK